MICAGNATASTKHHENDADDDDAAAADDDDDDDGGGCFVIMISHRIRQQAGDRIRAIDRVQWVTTLRLDDEQEGSGDRSPVDSGSRAGVGETKKREERERKERGKRERLADWRGNPK